MCQGIFIDAMMAEIFTRDGVGAIFCNNEVRNIYVEKNNFFQTIKKLIKKDQQRKFEFNFLLSGSIDILDGQKINEMLQSVNEGLNIFMTFGKKGSNSLFNLLLQTNDSPEQFTSGWFLKLQFESHPSVLNFLNEHWDKTGIVLVASTPLEIKSRSKNLKNITTFK